MLALLTLLDQLQAAEKTTDMLDEIMLKKAFSKHSVKRLLATIKSPRQTFAGNH